MILVIRCRYCSSRRLSAREDLVIPLQIGDKSFDSGTVSKVLVIASALAWSEQRLENLMFVLAVQIEVYSCSSTQDGADSGLQMAMRVKTADEDSEEQAVENGSSESRKIECRRVLSPKLLCLFETVIPTLGASCSTQKVLPTLGVQSAYKVSSSKIRQSSDSSSNRTQSDRYL